MGAGITPVADAGIHLYRRLTFGHIEQRLRDIVIYQRGFHRGHGRDQIKGFKLRKGERTVIHRLVQYHALSRLQPGVLSTCNRFDQQLQMTFEDATLVVLRGHLQVCARRTALKLGVGLRNHIGKMFFQLFTRVPGGSRPDDAQCNNNARSDKRFLHSDYP